MPQLFIRYCLILFILVLFCDHANADADYRWLIRTSVYTTHFDHDPDHNNNSQLIGLDYYLSDQRKWLVGGNTFRNSWDQRSVYLYAGRRFDWVDNRFYGKLTAGALWGWRGEHQDAIPLNQLGVAPAIIPAVGFQAGRFTSEFVVFGINGLMINIGAFF